MDRADRIFVAGHKGMLDSPLVRATKRGGSSNLTTASRQQVDLGDSASVAWFFERERPAYVLLAAAKVGGIDANRCCPAELIYDKLVRKCLDVSKPAALGFRPRVTLDDDIRRVIDEYRRLKRDAPSHLK